LAFNTCFFAIGKRDVDSPNLSSAGKTPYWPISFFPPLLSAAARWPKIVVEIHRQPR
jgi:hypothetical protein